MLNIIIALFVFCVVLFFYLHIQFHLKTSDDLEIYEIEQASKDKMEEICDLRQPVLFDCDEEDLKIIQNSSKSALLENYPVFEIKIRENTWDTNSELYIPLQLHVAEKLFKEDKMGSYFSENNGDFLVETGAVKNMLYNDEFLRPHLVSNCYYDVVFGSANVQTPFRYEINYRNYFTVTQGSVHIKLSPPKSSRYLYPVNDYENLEFRSPVNPWSPQSKFKADFAKIKCLEIVLTPGKFLFIPAYWWYSFKLADNTSISCFRYRTYMNNIAICPNLFMSALQNQNVERKIAKKFVLPKHLSPSSPVEGNSETVAANSEINALNEINVVEDKPLEEEDPLETGIGSTDISSIPPILLEPGSKDAALHGM